MGVSGSAIVAAVLVVCGPLFLRVGPLKLSGLFWWLSGRNENRLLRRVARELHSGFRYSVTASGQASAMVGFVSQLSPRCASPG